MKYPLPKQEVIHLEGNPAVKVEVGKSYHIYGKLPGMKRFQPLSGETFAANRIHAEIFEIDDEDDLEDFMELLDELNEQGEFEPRVVKGWKGNPSDDPFAYDPGPKNWYVNINGKEHGPYIYERAVEIYNFNFDVRPESDIDMYQKDTRENPLTGMTAKGRRMYEDVKKSGSAYAPSAVVYAAAKRGVPGLVKKKWAEEHGYPKPNPAIPGFKSWSKGDHGTIFFDVPAGQYVISPPAGYGDDRYVLEFIPHGGEPELVDVDGHSKAGWIAQGADRRPTSPTMAVSWARKHAARYGKSNPSDSILGRFYADTIDSSDLRGIHPDLIRHAMDMGWITARGRRFSLTSVGKAEKARQEGRSNPHDWRVYSYEGYDIKFQPRKGSGWVVSIYQGGLSPRHQVLSDFFAATKQEGLQEAKDRIRDLL